MWQKFKLPDSFYTPIMLMYDESQGFGFVALRLSVENLHNGNSFDF